jgi:flavin-dependent dehydrogenase
MEGPDRQYPILTQAIPQQIDVAIIGAGPAGATLATLLKKYRPETNVWVFEKERFPRHRVGEGLIVDINRVLADMGALDKLDQAGFPKKYGTTFVWGEDRCPSTFLFRDGAALVDPPDGYQLDYTWHVDRPTYDKILADCAAEMGANVCFEHQVVDLLMADDAVTGVRVAGPDGREHEVQARYVVDCAGLRGPVTRRLGGRVVDNDLRNIALFGYHRSLAWRDDLQGPPELRRTLIMTHPLGWVWVIPISRTETSVGFVTRIDTYQEEKAKRGDLDPEQFYFDILSELPEFQELFAGSEPIDYRGDGRLVHAVQEFSFTCKQLWGEGWVTCGDSSGFVDAILSIGCYVAQSHAQFLAYALGSVFDGADESLALSSYGTTVEENLGAFRAVTHMFYAYNATRSDWWHECSELLRSSSLVPKGSEREAFLAFVNGFSARNALYEEAVSAFGRQFLVTLGQRLLAQEELFDEHASYQEQRRIEAMLERDPVVLMACPYDTTPFYLPRTGTGRLAPVIRLDLRTTDPHRPGQEIGRRLYLKPALLPALQAIDGRRRLSEIAQLMTPEDPATGINERLEDVRSLVFRLAAAGALVDVHGKSQTESEVPG